MKALNVLAAVMLSTGVYYTPSSAQAGECTSGLCGTPDQSGGACGCGCGSILIAMTDRGDTYQFADDFDGDGIEDDFDNCPFSANFDQADGDGDLVGDGCDLCGGVVNPDQVDTDLDGIGDVCDNDIDNDGFTNDRDNCPFVRNSNKDDDPDGDLKGNACDTDDDGDGEPDVSDPCRLEVGTTGTNCTDDPDNDGIDEFGERPDNCPAVNNPLQKDADNDNIGDACDTDKDGDGRNNWEDNCPGQFNPNQLDFDRDGAGDAGIWPGTANSPSCDSEECYVVGQEGNCLRPEGAFNVMLSLDPALANGTIRPGDTVVVHLFSNRLGLTHNWQASFRDLPSKSDTTLKNARSSASTLGRFAEVAQPTGSGFNRISFVADKPGSYEVSVQVTLANGDPNPDFGTSVSTQAIRVDVAEDESGGCAAGASSGVVVLALGLVALVRRRRR